MADPASPASAPRPNLDVSDQPKLPPVRPFDLVGVVLAALPTVGFSAMLAVVLSLNRVVKVPPPMAALVVFGVFPAIGLAVFVRRWWISLRSLDDKPSWAFLAVPFFIVVGAALGVAFTLALRR